MIGRSIIATALALACAAACASSRQTANPGTASSSIVASNNAASAPSVTYETETATPAAPTGAYAHPPETPCIYPADEPSTPAAWDPGFVGILQESDLVVEANIEVKFQRLSQTSDQVYWSQLIDDVDVLRSRTTPPPTVTGLYAQGDPGQPPYGWPPGRYVLLLLPPQNGMSTPSDGMSGMFRIVDGHALRFCPNYDDPAHPIAASGNPPTLDELLALIPPELPQDIVSPKPGAATVTSAVASN